MQAYIITDRNGDSEHAMVVFGETHGKALAYAARSDELCDYGYTGLRATRAKALDEFYHGTPELDWEDDNDRYAMVRYAGFYCDINQNGLECDECSAYEYCEKGKARK